jgi:hypothetical protein
MVLVILVTGKNRRKKEMRTEEELEAGALDASEKYLNIASV